MISREITFCNVAFKNASLNPTIWFKTSEFIEFCWKDILAHFWVKPDHQGVGTNEFIPAVEMAVTAFKPNRHSIAAELG